MKDEGQKKKGETVLGKETYFLLFKFVNQNEGA